MLANVIERGRAQCFPSHFTRYTGIYLANIHTCTHTHSHARRRWRELTAIVKGRYKKKDKPQRIKPEKAYCVCVL